MRPRMAALDSAKWKATSMSAPMVPTTRPMVSSRDGSMDSAMKGGVGSIIFFVCFVYLRVRAPSSPGLLAACFVSFESWHTTSAQLEVSLSNCGGAVTRPHTNLPPRGAPLCKASLCATRVGDFGQTPRWPCSRVVASANRTCRLFLRFCRISAEYIATNEGRMPSMQIAILARKACNVWRQRLARQNTRGTRTAQRQSVLNRLKILDPAAAEAHA